MRRPPAESAGFVARMPDRNGHPRFQWAQSIRFVRGRSQFMSVGSRVDAVPESFDEVFRSKAVAIVSTLGPDGAPHVSPVWYFWDGEHIKFQVFTTFQKYKNLTRDPRISVAVIDPNNSAHYIEFRGTATISNEREDELDRAIARKYLDSEPNPHELADQTRSVTVTPHRIITMG
jgi:PPOX class probable F420-dependent enzyme